MFDFREMLKMMFIFILTQNLIQFFFKGNAPA
jgi:hypothetical protein